MKRGFTLIELMAVIVVLGVIATISVIAVDKIIKENKENAYKAQIATIEDAARTWGVKNIKELPDNDGEAISVPLLYFKNDGIISKDFKNPKTNKPFNDDLYVNISYEGGIYKYEVAEESGLGIDTNPKILNGKYVVQILCEEVATATTGNVPQGKFVPGDEYKCELGDGEKRTFFVLETNGDEVSLIMNKNLDNTTVTWSNDGSNHKDEDESVQAVTAKAALTEKTSNWSKITDKSRITLPSASQIARASSKTFNNNAITGLAKWLYGNIDSSSTPFGYWTSTPRNSNYDHVWYVYYDGSLNGTASVTNGTYFGIRPVIKISKLQIKNSASTTLCKAVSSATTGNVPSGTYAYGDEYTCELGDGEERTFFVLETSGDNVSLIMNKNFTDDTISMVAWCIDGGVDTTTCKNINSKEEETPLKHIQDTFGSNVTVSLPTPSQIATASWQTFNGTGRVSGLSLWLYDYLLGKEIAEPLPWGYWTSLPQADVSDCAWLVAENGRINSYYVGNDEANVYGIRPVITIPKSQLQ